MLAVLFGCLRVGPIRETRAETSRATFLDKQVDRGLRTRLVVDTGIHAKRWTREQAIAYYRQNTPDTERDCIRMVERHIVMASQATAYKIGMLKILELREKAKKALRNRFDIRVFHDVVLRGGPLPLTVLEQMVDEYIESEAR